jgi:hypothetical protein
MMLLAFRPYGYIRNISSRFPGSAIAIIDFRLDVINRMLHQHIGVVGNNLNVYLMLLIFRMVQRDMTRRDINSLPNSLTEHLFPYSLRRAYKMGISFCTHVSSRIDRNIWKRRAKRFRQPLLYGLIVHTSRLFVSHHSMGGNQ